ncbi:hypothetical protein [Microvirga terricola]|uniref:Lipoprotein n=1 Tax=Microvirga terricola TaxID=2719797 RepID=A0ABX0VC74_9HYPH|nr:hypothetical protein [Microvirga terricola]NIX77103.1 hypothetical protein [Microvirga terricola]
MRYITNKLTWIFAISAVFAVSTTTAQASNTSSGRIEVASAQNGKVKKPARAATGQYFIEFRSRYALSYGHTFAMFGRLNAKGSIVEREVAGLHPKGDSPVPWMIGHVVPVASETGPSDGDLEEQYVSARYRVLLNDAEYAKVIAFIRKLQANSPLWSAVAYNCNAFVADIARYMGLGTPSSTLLYPADFINELRKINGGRDRASLADTTQPVQ